MSIDLKVGEWYETRGGLRLRVLADVSDNPTLVRGDCIVTVAADGDVMCYYPNGNYCWGDSDDEDSSYTVVKHLPGCTGWDWVEEKWRDATINGLNPHGPVPCRVQNKGDAKWIDAELRGYVVDSLFPFIVHYYYDPYEDPHVTAYALCQILDTEDK